MRFTFNISDNIGKELRETTKANNTTITKIVEQALSLYFAMHKSAKAFTEAIENSKEKGQRG